MKSVPRRSSDALADGVSPLHQRCDSGEPGTRSADSAPDQDAHRRQLRPATWLEAEDEKASGLPVL